MSNQVKLLLGIHCHQPVDNFGYVIDDAVKKCYLPYMEAAVKHPEFKFSIHYSGWLLEYIYKNHKSLFKLMQQASEAGSVEFFTGGYYEPVLASIPSKDRIDQIKKLNKFIQKHFKQTPKGLWLTERVWDNSIIPDLVQCGIEYVIVDDYHFTSIGFKEEQMDGYYMTEEGGHTMKIFPISKELRYRIPFKPVDVVQGYLHESLQNVSHNPAGVIFDDGEKFGVWPGTYDWVYKDKWLENFIEMVNADEKIAACTYAEYVESELPKGMAYLPTTSYFEMGEWSLNAEDCVTMEHLQALVKRSELGEDAVRFVKGGIWKNFLVKYEESNRLHKRILELSSKRKEVKGKVFEDNLFRAETNDVLWHGVFGGLYLPNLRDNAYKFIINAENARYKDIKKEEISIEDNNMDGYDEVKAVSEKYIAIFDTRLGGQMTEFDVREKSFNWQNTLTRRKEAYHYKLENTDESHEEASEGIDTIHSMDFSKLEEYKKHFKFDRYIKNSFIDHVVDYDFQMGNFEWNNFREYGNFVCGEYEAVPLSGGVELKCHGELVGNNEVFPANLSKVLKFQKTKIHFDIKMESNCHYELQYMLEFNFHFADLKQVSIDGEKFKESFFKEQVNGLRIRDGYLKNTLNISFKQPANVLVYQLNTVSQSEGGFDLTNQGICIGFTFPFKKVFSISGDLSVGA